MQEGAFIRSNRASKKPLKGLGDLVFRINVAAV
jgi:hypothetical protein